MFDIVIIYSGSKLHTGSVKVDNTWVLPLVGGLYNKIIHSEPLENMMCFLMVKHHKICGSLFLTNFG